MIPRARVLYQLSNKEGMVGKSCGKVIITVVTCTVSVATTVSEDQLTPCLRCFVSAQNDFFSILVCQVCPLKPVAVPGYAEPLGWPLIRYGGPVLAFIHLKTLLIYGGGAIGVAGFEQEGHDDDDDDVQ